MSKAPPQPPTEWDALIEVRLRQVYRAVSDLALALNTNSRIQREGNSEMRGVLTNILAALHPNVREPSRKFQLPGGNSIELSAGTRKAIMERSGKIALTIVLIVASHIAAYFGLPRPEKPAVAHPPAQSQRE